MPNWCNNTLTVSGPQEIISRMRSEIRGKQEEVLDFEMILPTPRDLLEGQGWYDWRVANWGTKWNADDSALEEISAEEMVYYFMSAWSPPIQVIAALGKNFPSLSFNLQYSEPGCAFKGRFVVENGLVTFNESENIEESYGD